MFLWYIFLWKTYMVSIRILKLFMIEKRFKYQLSERTRNQKVRKPYSVTDVSAGRPGLSLPVFT